MTALPRILLASSSVLLALGSFMHTSAFGGANDAAGASNLPAFYANSLRALWLIDSASLLILAIAFALLAARPTLARWPVVLLLSMIPVATAAALYAFMGSFLPAHLLLVAGLLPPAAVAIRGGAPNRGSAQV